MKLPNELTLLLQTFKYSFPQNILGIHKFVPTGKLKFCEFTTNSRIWLCKTNDTINYKDFFYPLCSRLPRIAHVCGKFLRGNWPRKPQNATASVCRRKIGFVRGVHLVSVEARSSIVGTEGDKKASVPSLTNPRDHQGGLSLTFRDSTDYKKGIRGVYR